MEDILPDFTKKIIEFCEKAKADFSKAIGSYFKRAEAKPADLDTIPSLPSKRPQPPSASTKPKSTLPNKKPKRVRDTSSESSSERETEYDEAKFSNRFNTSLHKAPQGKTVDDELKEVFSSEDYSLMNSDSDKSNKSAETKACCDIEELINDLKSGKDRKKTLDQIEKFVMNFSKLEPKEKERSRKLLAVVDTLRIPQDDIHIKARFKEVNAQIKKITNSLSIEEDWPRLTELFRLAIREKNTTKINEFTRRISDNFPEVLTQSLIAELSPLIFILKAWAETVDDCEAKQRTSRIIQKWTTKASNSEKKPVLNAKKVDDIIKGYKKSDLENATSKSINFIDAGKSVPFKSRRK